MIHIVDGDLMSAKENIIGHQVNAKGAMASGVAKLIRDKYPNVYGHYQMFCSVRPPSELLGQLHLVKVGIGKYVANIFGQLNYGRDKVVYTDYDGFRKSLTELKRRAKDANLSIALPYNIGCGLANGNWEIVYDIIEEVFFDYEVTLYRIK